MKDKSKSMTIRKFGKKVRELRLKNGWTQKELALKANLHRNYISDLERGTRNVAINAIEKLAKGLDIKMKDLMDLENE